MIILLWISLIFTVGGIILIIYALANHDPERDIFEKRQPVNPFKRALYFKTRRAFRAYLLGFSLIVLGPLSGSIYWSIQIGWL